MERIQRKRGGFLKSFALSFTVVLLASFVFHVGSALPSVPQVRAPLSGNDLVSSKIGSLIIGNRSSLVTSEWGRENCISHDPGREKFTCLEATSPSGDRAGVFHFLSALKDDTRMNDSIYQKAMLTTVASGDTNGQFGVYPLAGSNGGAVPVDRTNTDTVELRGKAAFLIADFPGNNDSMMVSSLIPSDILSDPTANPPVAGHLNPVCADGYGKLVICQGQTSGQPTVTYHWHEGAWGDCVASGSGSCSGTYTTTTTETRWKCKLDPNQYRDGNEYCDNLGSFQNCGVDSPLFYLPDGNGGYTENGEVCDISNSGQCTYRGDDPGNSAGGDPCTDQAADLNVDNQTDCENLFNETLENNFRRNPLPYCKWVSYSVNVQGTGDCSTFTTESSCTAESGCTWTDAQGTKTRTVECHDEFHNVVADSNCNQGSRPDTSTSCTVSSNTSSTSNNSGSSSSSNTSSTSNNSGSSSSSNTSSGAVNGSCESYTETYTTQPATDTASGCTSGTYQDETDTIAEWKWSCLGSNGGTNASCSASKEGRSYTCNNSGAWVADNQTCSPVDYDSNPPVSYSLGDAVCVQTGTTPSDSTCSGI